jgi:hypothetical protein
VASVDRPMLVELIEAEKASLSPEALKLWKELEVSHYFSNEAERMINEDFSSEEADAFLRHQDHTIDILERFEQMPEDDRRSKNVLTELWMGLKRSDEAESRGEPAQPYRDECVINALIMKDRSATQSAQEGAERHASTMRDRSDDVGARRRPWWQRVFGG